MVLLFSNKGYSFFDIKVFFFKELVDVVKFIVLLFLFMILKVGGKFWCYLVDVILI